MMLNITALSMVVYLLKFAVQATCFQQSVNGRYVSDEARLLTKLFGNYDKEVRPVQIKTEKVNVSFGMALVQIVNVNSKNQFLTVSVWVRQQWNNTLLSWDPVNFGGIKQLNVEPTKLWIPDIILYNTADGTHGGGTIKYKTKVILEYTGQNKWFSPASFTSTCDINVKDFPFDQQTCTMKFGSWTYGGDRLTMHTTDKSSDLSKYITNGEWHLVNLKANLNINKYSCCEYLFYDVTFSLTVKRKPLYYIFNLILPCAIISTLTLMKFFLPVESGEKIGLGITVLLAMTVFLMIVADSLPSTSHNVPLLGAYFVALMFNTSLSLIATTFILGCYYKNPSMTPMPDWFRKLVFVHLSRLLHLKSRESYLENRKHEANQRRKGTSASSMNGSAGSHSPPTGLGTPLANIRETVVHSIDGQQATSLIDLDWEKELIASNNTEMMPQTNHDSCMSYETLVNPLSYKVIEGIETIAESYRQLEDYEEKKDEWRHASLVLDYFCFWVFLLLNVLSIFAIFIQLAIPGSHKH